MDNTTLLTLITGDSEANALAMAFNDAGCAARCCVIAPKIVSPTPIFLDARAIAKVLAAASLPFAVGALMSNLRAIASSGQTYSPTVSELIPALVPGGGGLDFTDQNLVTQLTSFTNAGLLNSTHLAAIVASTMVSQVITADQVSAAMLGHR
jgi:hypothetical protein